MFKKTMEFCNKGMVWVDPPPPVMVKDHIKKKYSSLTYKHGIGVWREH